MTLSNEHWFSHEKLEVYREAIAFVGWRPKHDPIH